LERNLKVGNSSKNFQFPSNGTVDMKYAFGKGGKIDYHGPMQYGVFKLDINTNLRVAYLYNSELDHTEITEKFYLHGVVMYITWGVLPLLMVISGRYMKHLYSFRMWIHRLVGAIIQLVTGFYVIYLWMTEHGR
jgi:glucan phosphoethanolaminetransferase (alkaline phosphatase superfamily)